MTSLSPNVGAIGGSLLIAKVEGVGPLGSASESSWSANGINLINSATRKDICQNIKIRSYGVVECITIPGAVDSGTVVAAYSLRSKTVAVCENADSTLCTYEQ